MNNNNYSDISLTSSGLDDNEFFIKVNTLIKFIALTRQPNAFLSVPGVPCLQLARFTAVKYFFASCAGRQADCNGAPTLITVPKPVFHYLLSLLQSLSGQS